MTDKHDLLLEIGTEEMPARLLQTTLSALQKNLTEELEKAQLTFGEVKGFVTPRRLAIWIKDLSDRQPQRVVERKGPALAAAYDANGNPSKAAEGFARSCGVEVKALPTQQTEDGAWLIFRFTEAGKTTNELLPDIINKSLSAIPIPKPMRWGDSAIEFIRPIHWVVLLYADKVVPATILEVQASNVTYGHRFHHPHAITIHHASDYTSVLRKAYVIADFVERRDSIFQQLKKIAAKCSAHLSMDETLLDEVTGLVEWPVALLGSFNQDFLAVPQEALILALKQHQKCFHLVDNDNKLLPYFITVSNIESHDPPAVIKGNERVVAARLTDAKFFYETDKKYNLKTYRELLKKSIFQEKLGTVFDKTERIAEIAQQICDWLQDKNSYARKAGQLCKADLVTAMVGEFPELQGVMGYYYALNGKEDEQVAIAIRDHYLPRFAGDALPTSLYGNTVAIADRIDTIVGIFSINQIPTGEKDPFGLRRAALGILRIVIEKELVIDLQLLIKESAKLIDKKKSENAEFINQVQAFILERLRTWYMDKGIAADTIEAVLSLNLSSPLDIHRRIMALHAFRQRPEALVLAAANKRAKNILVKSNFQELSDEWQIDPKLLQESAEKDLYEQVSKRLLLITSSEVNQSQYTFEERLSKLAELKDPIDQFFDTVRVDIEDEILKRNRLALLSELRKLFLSVADISILQG